MYPTMKHGQYIYAKNYNQLSHKNIERWKIGLISINDKKSIKRIVGLPNEEVTIANGDLIVNGKILPIPSTLSRIYRDLTFHGVASQDQVLVMGDNFLDSFDSRKFGPLALDSLLGIVKLRLWPPKKF